MKNLLIIALIAICGLLGFKLLTIPKADPTAKKIAQTGRDLVDIDVQTITKKVGTDGIERALINDKEQLVKSYNDLEAESQRKLDSIAAIVGIQQRRINRYTSTIATIRDSLLKATNQGDTVYTYSDKFANISFNRPKELFSFKYNAELNMIEYWNRSWFLTPKRNYVEFWMADPRATINGVKRVVFEPKKDNFDLKLKATGQYHLNELGFGGKVSLRIGRVTGNGSYLYYPSFGNWQSSFGVDYDLGGF